MNIETMVAQIRAIQMSARALDLACESFFALVEEEKTSRAAKVEDDTCKHPRARRQACGVMGHPDRFRCLECNEIVDPAVEAKA